MNMFNEITTLKIIERLEEKIEKFKTERIKNCVSVKDFYDKSLDLERQKIEQIVGDEDLTNLVLHNRRNNFEIRRMFWFNLNKIKTLVDIKRIVDDEHKKEMETFIDQLKYEHNLYSEEILEIVKEEKQVLDLVYELFEDEDADRIKNIMYETWEDIIGVESFLNVQLNYFLERNI